MRSRGSATSSSNTTARRRSRHPIYSLMGDWVMFADILRGRVRL
jgi:hypothetical protein